MADSPEELEPLFDYSRVQPSNVVSLDDDSSDESPTSSPKRRKVGKGEKNEKSIDIVDCEEKEEEEDWLLPPPKVQYDEKKLGEDSTIKEMRLKKQELVSFAQSAGDLFRAVEESAKREFNASHQSSLETVANQSSKSSSERPKIVISLQNKDELKQLRVYKDDKFERIFKMYADKAGLDLGRLVFCFDGDKISPTATPDGLGMEDDDIIEVHQKSG